MPLTKGRRPPASPTWKIFVEIEGERAAGPPTVFVIQSTSFPANDQFDGTP